MTIVHAHDQFVRKVMSNLDIAREFFDIHLPEKLRGAIDLDHLILQPRSFINDVRKEAIVDMLYQTKIADNNAYLYLIIEHQSKPDKFLPFRMMKYIFNVMDTHLEKENHLPLVFPMVIYHGIQPYPYSTDIKTLIRAPENLIQEYFLKPFLLTDLSQIEDEEIKKHARIGVMEFVLKHIFSRDFLPHLQNIAELMRRVAQSGEDDYVSIILQYALERGNLNNKKEAFFKLIHNEISKSIGEEIMTLAEQLRAEGRLEGKLEGRLEGKLEGKTEGKLEVAERLLSQGMTIQFIAEITGFSVEKIKSLQKELA